MIVTRIGVDKRLKNAKPCLHCKKMLLRFGIKQVFYSTEGSMVCEKTKELDSRLTGSYRHFP